MDKKTLPFWGTLLTLTGVIILCGLGTWQLQRLEWKTDLLKKLDQAYEQQPALIKPDALNENLHLTRAKLAGRFINKHITIGPRTHEGTPGYHVLTPFKLNRSEHILVNRGWVPLDHEKISAPTSQINAIGLLRTPEKANMFVPKNNPANNQWHQMNLTEMAEALKVKSLKRIILYAENAYSENITPSGEKPTPNNNHLQYALFWFAMAGAMMSVYILRFITKKKN